MNWYRPNPIAATKTTAPAMAARSAVRYAVTHDPPARSEEARDLFGYDRQQGRRVAAFDLVAIDDRYAHRQMAYVGLVAGAGNDNLGYLDVLFHVLLL